MRLGNGPTPLNVPVFAKKMYEKKCGEVGLKIQRKQQEVRTFKIQNFLSC